MSGIDLGAVKLTMKVDGVQKAQKELNDVSSTTKQVEDSSKSAQNSFKSLGSAFMDAVKNTNIFGNSLDSLTSGLSNTGTQSAMLGGAMAALVSGGIQLVISAVTQLVASFKELIVETYNVGKAFESQMSRVSSIAGATAEESKQLTKTAREFGAQTVFSATEAAQALEYMGMAGWTTQQMMSGMSGVLSLAAASGEDLALVSDTVTDVLTALGESADQAGRMADVFAAASVNSNTNVSKMAYTMKYAAPVAGALSYSMEDVAIATGLMANAGIKGETAGTSLRSMFTELQGAVEITGKEIGKYVVETTNADGSMRELSEIIVDLRTGFSGLTESEKALNAESLVGKTAMSGLLAVVNASETDFNKLSDSIYNSAGAADKMSKQMTDNIDGLEKGIKSKFESIQLSIFSIFEPIIKGFLKLTDAAIGFNEKMWSIFSGVASKFTAIGTVFIDNIVAIFNTAVDLIVPIIEPIFLIFETLYDNCYEMLKTLSNASMELLEQIKNALMPLVDFINDTLMALVDILVGDFESAGERIEHGVKSLIVGIINLILLIPNAIIAVCNIAIDNINNICNTTIDRIGYLSVTFEELFGDTEDVADDMAKGVGNSMSQMTSDIAGSCEDMEDRVKRSLEALSKAYDNYYNNKMREYEKQLREQYSGGTLAEEKKIQRKLLLHEEMLKKKLEEDEKYEQRRSELEQKYRSVSVTEGNKTTITYVPRYANGTNNAKGGLSLVGEAGRELMYIPPQAQIINNNSTEQILQGMNNNSGVEKGIEGLRSDLRELKRVIKMLPSEQQMLVRGGTC